MTGSAQLCGGRRTGRARLHWLTVDMETVPIRIIRKASGNPSREAPAVEPMEMRGSPLDRLSAKGKPTEKRVAALRAAEEDARPFVDKAPPKVLAIAYRAERY